ncbi:MAG: acetate--CoA ligase family protein, partial [Acidimicrobiales bacterium]|nr:acetate--CoA ligase family protein [Acidimicrobiales bacterium]
AGFETATKFADGVVEVRLGLAPTPEAEAAIEGRARCAASQAVRRLLSPRSVAVIGAGRAPGGIGHEVIRHLQRVGFQGPVWPVNDKADHVASVRAVDSILDIADDVDLAVIAVPAPLVVGVVEECGRKQVYGAVILSAGFAESGAVGAALEAEVLRVARTWGVRVVGPNCLGLINTNPAVRLHATFAPAFPLPGRVALLSESGMVGAAIIGQAREVGVGISSFLALGNRADVSGNDLLQYWEGDEHTDVVCMYIESFGNARHFSRQARRLSRAKPVVAVKAGWLPGTARPPRPPDATDDVLLRQTGIIGVPTLSALLDTTRLLVCQPVPAGGRVAILGNAGGSLAIGADAAVEAGLELAALGAATRDGLGALVDHAVGDANPIDLGLRADREAFERATALLSADEGVDVVLVVYAPSLGATAEEVRDALDAGRRPSVAVAACFYGDAPVLRADPDPLSVPVYRAVDAAARALGRVAEYASWLAAPEGAPVELDPDLAADARAVVVAALDRGDATLTLADTSAVLGAAGLAVVPTAQVGSLDEACSAAASLGWPVALKAAGRDAMAKTVVAGLALDLADEAALASAWARMAERFGDALAPALVQSMVEPGVDVAVAVDDHLEVGPVVSLRPGGAAAALDRAADVRVLPVGDLEARRMVAGSRLAPYLSVSAHERVEQLLLRLGALVEEVPEIAQVTFNPVIVSDGAATIVEAQLTIRAVSATGGAGGGGSPLAREGAGSAGPEQQ